MGRWCTTEVNNKLELCIITSFVAAYTSPCHLMCHIQYKIEIRTLLNSVVEILTKNLFKISNCGLIVIGSCIIRSI